MAHAAPTKSKINTNPTQPARKRAAQRAAGGGKTARRGRGQARVSGDTRESVRDSARVVVEAECGILVYPPEEAGEPWRAVFTENGRRRFRQAMTEAELAAKLEKVTDRLRAGAPDMERPGADLIAHYLDPDRLPVSKRWSRRHADTQRRLCRRFAAPVIAAVTCQDITTGHMQQIVSAAPTASEGDRLHAVLRRGLRPVPAAAPGREHRLRRGGQQRGHRRDRRAPGQLRRLRRADDRGRASRRQRRTGHPAPADLGGEGVVYNLSLPSGARLHLTGPVLAAIYLGQITHWNDPALTALNPGLSLPNAAVTVVHRSDGSGTAYIFSNYLSSVDPAWAAKVGTGKTLNWPAGDGEEGNGGVATAVNRIPFSIGYVEQAYSQGLLLPFAAIRKQAGNYVIPSAQTVTADAARKPAITPNDFSIVNQPGPASYPISGNSWALIYTHQPNQATGQALVAMLDWLTRNGQAYAASNGYVPLPAQVQQLAHTMLQQVTGPNGTQLLS